MPHEDPSACTCCNLPESEIEIDPISGLCLYCQPCPRCGRFGTGCDDRYAHCNPSPAPPLPEGGEARW